MYRNADKATEAAKLLAQIASEIGGSATPFRAKQLHVLAALEVERFKQSALDLQSACVVKKGGF